jgi:hypothetical protein
MASRRRPQAARPSARRGAPTGGRPSWAPLVASVVVVGLLVATFVFVRWATAPSAPAAPSTAASDRVVTTITSIPSPELDRVGLGSASNTLQPVSGQPLAGPGGKPELLHVGAEYCPYCAAQRWPLMIALSRFGTFSGLTTTTSSSSDAYPNTPTFSFRDAKFTSQYVDFVAVETSDRSGKPLQSLTSEQQALLDKYDAAPYTSTPGAIPFLDFSNRYMVSGSTYSPDVLQGMTWQQVADALKQPSSPQARAILGSANLMTAAICQTTGQQPVSACSTPAVQSIESSLAAQR